MQNELPFFDTPEDALKGAVQHIGGAKKVGSMIWPDKSVDAACRLLLDCLNPSRAEKLELTQILQILSLAKEEGYNTAFFWFANQVGYDAHPITKAEEEDRLVTAVENALNQLSKIVPALERIKGTDRISERLKAIRS